MSLLQQMIKASASSVCMHRRAVLQVRSVLNPRLAIYLWLSLCPREELFQQTEFGGLLVPELSRQQCMLSFLPALSPAHPTRCSPHYDVPRHAALGDLLVPIAR